MQFISLLNEEERFCWLQQDGATSHTAKPTMEMLKQFFDDRIISKSLWPPRSSDVTPADYFLWVYLKQVVYSNRSQTIEELKKKHCSCHIEYLTRNFKEISVKHGDSCELLIRRKWRSFSTFTVKFIS
jgi:hypothetical protein